MFSFKSSLYITTFCLYIHLLMDMDCFHLLALVINAIVEHGCTKYLFESLFSILLSINPGVELLGYIAILFSFFRSRQTSYVFCRYFLPICDLSFHSLNSIFHTVDGFHFSEVQITSVFNLMNENLI